VREPAIVKVGRHMKKKKKAHVSSDLKMYHNRYS
jgi:hypothetical protein